MADRIKHIQYIHTAPSNILNLSTSLTLTTAQTTLLEKGLTFIPRPTTLDREELRRDLSKYHRRLALLDYFQYTPYTNFTPFTQPSHWQPPSAHRHPHITRLIKTDLDSYHHLQPTQDTPDNITAQQRQAIHQLKSHPHIIIKPADKGSKIVILDTHQYLFEANRQLTNTSHYKPIPSNIQPITQIKLRHIIHSLYTQKFITAKQRNFLFGPDNPRPRIFYGNCSCF